MPRLTHRLPSYRLHKASGQAVVTLGGRDIYLGGHGSPESRREYDRVMAEWLTGDRRPNAPVTAPATAECPTGCTVDELLAAFWEHAERWYVKHGKPTGELSNLRDAMRPLCRLYGHTEAHAFGPSSLKAVRQDMIAAGWCRRTINSRVNRVRRIFRWAVSNELVPPGIIHGLEAVEPLKRGRCDAPDGEPVRPVAEADMRSVLPHLPSMVRAMILIQWETGARPGEVVLMRPCDLEITDSHKIYRPHRHKTEHFGHTREIYLGPESWRVILPFLKRPSDAYLFRPIEALRERYARRRTHRREVNSVRSTSRRVGDHYTAGSYARAIATACRRAGISCWSPNQLRHAAATRFRRVHGLDVAQVLLGHRTAQVTQVYAEVDRRKAITAMQSPPTADLSAPA